MISYIWNVVSVRPANIYNITNELVKFILRRCEQLDRIKRQSWKCCRVHFDVAVTLLALRPERRLHQMYDITLRSYRNSQLLSLTISLKISEYIEIILTLLSFAVWRYGRDRRTVSRRFSDAFSVSERNSPESARENTWYRNWLESSTCLLWMSGSFLCTLRSREISLDWKITTWATLMAKGCYSVGGVGVMQNSEGL